MLKPTGEECPQGFSSLGLWDEALGVWPLQFSPAKCSLVTCSLLTEPATFCILKHGPSGFGTSGAQIVRRVTSGYWHDRDEQQHSFKQHHCHRELYTDHHQQLKDDSYFGCIRCQGRSLRSLPISSC